MTSKERTLLRLRLQLRAFDTISFDRMRQSLESGDYGMLTQDQIESVIEEMDRWVTRQMAMLQIKIRKRGFGI